MAMRPHASSAFTVDVEDWFHLLDTPATPPIATWDALPSRLAQNLTRILDLLDEYDVKATFFWLGWAAERHASLLRDCHARGHEIGCHGYAHLLPFQVGRAEFVRDLRRGKSAIEDVLGAEIAGYRAPGFGFTPETTWAFEEVRSAGYRYDSSVFPAQHGHGGMPKASNVPAVVSTPSGPLAEVPQSVLRSGGARISVFGGGYLRLAPLALIESAVAKLHRNGQTFVLYVHPRDIDPKQPRLRLSPARYFKSYVNLGGTFAKLKALCRQFRFERLDRIAERVLAEHALRTTPRLSSPSATSGEPCGGRYV